MGGQGVRVECARSHGHRTAAVRPAACDVARGIADDDGILQRHRLLEGGSGATAGNRREGVAVAVVATKSAKREVASEPHGAQLQVRGTFQVACQQGKMRIFLGGKRFKEGCGARQGTHRLGGDGGGGKRSIRLQRMR